MVKINLLSNDEKLCRYNYQPEQQGEPGVFVFDKIQKKHYIEKLAENDEIDSPFYKAPIFHFIRNNINKLPDERIIAWY